MIPSADGRGKEPRELMAEDVVVLGVIFGFALLMIAIGLSMVIFG